MKLKKNTKMSKVTLGGKRLHDEVVEAFKVDMSGYQGASHNLSTKVRGTVAPGTLVPIYANVIEPADKFSMKITSAIRTEPAIGPLFGSFEYAIDVFTARASLYNKMMHNNRSTLARNMDKVYLPLIELTGPNIAHPTIKQAALNGQANEFQIGRSSLMKMLGVSGLGYIRSNASNKITCTVPADMMLMYYEIGQQFYCNKQEPEAYVISTRLVESPTTVTAIRYTFQPAYWYLWDGINPVELGIVATPTNDSPYSEIDLRGTGLRLTSDGICDVQLIYNEVIVPYQTNITVDGNDLGAGWDVVGNGSVIGRYAGVEVDADFAEEVLTIKFEKTTPGTYSFIIKAEPRSDAESMSLRTEAVLESFPLENIDLMRDRILEQPASSPLIIKGPEDVDEYFEGLPYTTNNTLFSNLPEAIPGLPGQTTVAGTGAGLLVKTYKADRFNTWLNTEYVESMMEAVGVAVTGSKVLINDLNSAESLYNLEARIAASNQTYKGWIQAAYGISPNIEAEVPVFRGGVVGNITFDEVISNTGTDTEPLGTLAGRGTLDGGSGKISFSMDEPGLVMAILSITPRIGYTQGNKWFTRRQTMDDAHKPEYDGIGYQPLLTDELHAATTERDILGVPTYRSVGKQPAWAEYMTDIDTNFGNFIPLNNRGYMVLNREYQLVQEATEPAFIIADPTTYINPAKHNYMFANAALDAQNFWVHVNFEITAYRKVAKKQIPRV